MLSPSTSATPFEPHRRPGTGGENARRLTLFRNNRPIKSYEIALGRQPVGAKQFEGDNKRPKVATSSIFASGTVRITAPCTSPIPVLRKPLSPPSRSARPAATS